jgi:serine/threonine protein kinase
MSKVSGKPDSIGQYLKIDLTRDILGVSSTGFVIRTCCSDEQGVSSRPCALKRIQTVDEEPPDLAKLLHENVVRLMHHWTEERALFLVMELMDGDLAMLMAGTKRAGASPFSLSVAVDIMLQIAKGMLHLHEMEVSHPHLKCDNVLYKLTENKAEAFRVGDVLVKLGGFGCSRPADVNSKGWDIVRFGLTCLAILTGDERSDDVSRAHMVPDMVVARSSIPETTPVILKDCIVSCLDMQSTFSDVVKVLLLAKSYLMQASNDEIMFSSESIQTEIVQTKTEGMFADIDYTSRQNLVI